MTYSHPSHLVWADQVQPGTIVLFRFPERDDGLAGKRRPCLVLGMRQGPTGLRIALAYGTSAETTANRGFDLRIKSERDCRGAGLTRPSRFVIARRITVPADDPRFDTGAHGSPIIGNLPGNRMTEFSTLMAGIGDLIFEDQVAGANRHSLFRSRGIVRQDLREPTLPRRHEITAPACHSRGDRHKPNRTVIVEHRRHRTLRPIPSVA